MTANAMFLPSVPTLKAQLAATTRTGIEYLQGDQHQIKAESSQFDYLKVSSLLMN